MFNLFLKKAPFVRIVVPIILGIWLGRNVDLSLKSSFLIFGIIAFLFLSFTIVFRRYPLYKLRVFTGILAFLFLLSFGNLYNYLRQSEVIDSNEEVYAKVMVLSDIGSTVRNQKYEVELISLDDDTLSGFKHSKGLVYVPLDKQQSNFNAGQILLLKGNFLPYSEPDNLYAFDYSQYLKDQRVAFRVLSDSVDVMETQANDFNPKVYSSHIKSYLQTVFRDYGLAEEHLAVLNALFLGDKSRLSYEQKRAFSSAGAMHLLAVSGLHLGIIYLILLQIVSFIGLKNKRVIKFGLIISALWFYAFVTGFSPSVLRACIMLTIVEFGGFVKRTSSIYNLLGASMFIIILIEPLSVFKVGFWLSHCAVASIVAFYPHIENWVHFRFPPFRWVWSMIAVSLAAQLGTFPISVYIFHEFPLYFIITNVLLIPIVSPLLLMIVLVALLSNLSLIPQLLMPAISQCFQLMGDVANLIDALPFATFNNLRLQWFQVFFLYAVVVSILICLQTKYIKHLYRMMQLMIVLVVSFYFTSLSAPKQVLYIAKVNQKSVVNYFDGQCNEVYVKGEFNERDIEYSLRGLWAQMGAPSEFNIHHMEEESQAGVLLSVGEQNVLVSGYKKLSHLPGTTHGIDYLILLEKPWLKAAELKGVKQVVISSGWSWYSRKKWLRGAEELTNIWDVKTQGSLIVKQS